MSLNPGMEQDFRDTIKRCNEMTLLAREAINEAIRGDKAGITITLQQMKEKAEAINDTISCDQDTLDTFTEFSET